MNTLNLQLNNLKSIEYKFEFENGHKAVVYKRKPNDLYILRSDVDFMKGTNLTTLGVETILNGLANMGPKK